MIPIGFNGWHSGRPILRIEDYKPEDMYIQFFDTARTGWPAQKKLDNLLEQDGLTPFMVDQISQYYNPFMHFAIRYSWNREAFVPIETVIEGSISYWTKSNKTCRTE